MKMKTGPHEGIRKVTLPLTKRVLDAHVADLEEWAEEEKYVEIKQEYLARRDRLLSLHKRLNKKIELPTEAS